MPTETPTKPDEPRPAHVDWSEPAEAEAPEREDIERDGVQPEIGPDEPDVDRRLEHSRGG